MDNLVTPKMQSEVDTMKEYIEKLRKASQNIMNMHTGYMESLANWDSKANKDDGVILLMGKHKNDDECEHSSRVSKTRIEVWDCPLL